MTREEAIKMAKADLKCMERDTSGQDKMCNSHKCDECSLNYERGNIGEQKEWLRLAIKALEQEPRWIPVTEKLPEYGKEVLTCSNGGFIEIQSLENSCNDGYWENQKGDWTDFDEVISWMPLPQPYKAESEVQE